MSTLTRHQMGSLLLGALRQAGLGVRDLFEGRQEPLSWFFRVLAYDQSELDILESGALDTLHAPSALVELVVDELALGLTNIEVGGLSTYLVPEGGTAEDELPALGLDPDVMLGFLHIDVAPPALWLDERESDPSRNEALATRLTQVAQEVGAASDTVEVHIEGALDPEGGWEDPRENVRPAGVAVHFSFDIPLVGMEERGLAGVFSRGADVASAALEGIRSVFRGDVD
ncbi:MAG: hypothetical protein OEU54_13710 [Gemmatimonadota bacterium]|nr:hypothetical protein [Gemmatimonadota bacterium]